MEKHGGKSESRPAAFLVAVCLTGALCFQLAYLDVHLSGLFIPSYACIGSLMLAGSARKAFYFGVLAGALIYGPQLGFFVTIFGVAAVVLWLILAFWVGLFAATMRVVRVKWGLKAGVLLSPFTWIGLEYFRSELYALKFTWINAGFRLAESPNVDWLLWPGTYGVGFLIMALSVSLLLLPVAIRVVAGFFLAVVFSVLAGLPISKQSNLRPENSTLYVAGIQVEFPDENSIPSYLDQALARHPDAELFMMSEYTLPGQPTQSIMDWCMENQKYLVLGGKDAVGDSYFNTAFVIGPKGDTLFRQAKSVPIQFFDDGMPARDQTLWESPWGRLAIPTCYDLSYTWVMDRFVGKGAQGILNPTMDVEYWGEHQHWLHSLVAPARAAEYRLPIFRVASSGVSQLIDRNGRSLEKTSVPGAGEIIGGRMVLSDSGRLPPDRIFSLVCTAFTIWLMLFLLLQKWIRRTGAAEGPSASN